MALTEDDFAEVQSALWKARRKWFNIGVRLGLSVNDLKTIDSEQKTLEDKLTEMILSWLRQTERCTWRALRKALKHHTVDRPDLAQKIRTNSGSDESQNCSVHV